MCSTQDSVIYPRLVAGEPFARETEGQLEYFAVDGLRTLCIAQATIDKTYYEVKLSTLQCVRFCMYCSVVCGGSAHMSSRVLLWHGCNCILFVGITGTCVLGVCVCCPGVGQEVLRCQHSS